MIQGLKQKLKDKKETIEQEIKNLTTIAEGWTEEIEKMKIDSIQLRTRVEMLSKENALLKTQQGEDEDHASPGSTRDNNGVHNPDVKQETGGSSR